MSGGWEELPHAWSQGRQPGGPPHLQQAVAARAQEGLEELFHVQGQKGRWYLIQGKEQQLHFAGAAVKRYPMSKVREPQVTR